MLATEAPPPAQSPEAPPPAQSLRVQLPVPVPNRHLGASGPGACLLCAAASPVFAPVSTSVPVAPACTVPSDVAQGPESPAQVKVSALIQLVLSSARNGSHRPHPCSLANEPRSSVPHTRGLTCPTCPESRADVSLGAASGLSVCPSPGRGRAPRGPPPELRPPRRVTPAHSRGFGEVWAASRFFPKMYGLFLALCSIGSVLGKVKT